MPRHSLTDELAIERTRLANERTLLAYVRTGLAIVAGGFGILQFLQNAAIGGAAMMVAGIATLAIGVWRFRQAKRELDEAAQRHSD